MTQFTRRSVLAGVAGTAALAATPSYAAAPMAGKQAPGVYRYKVGSYEVTAVTDGARTTPIPAGYVRNATVDEVNKALEAAFQPKDQVTHPFTPIVVNTGTKLVLIDTGWGPSPGTIGQLQASLAAAGIDPKAIDVVIASHLHPDHIGGMRTADGSLAFPNAEIMVHPEELKFWLDDGNLSRAPNPMVKSFFETARRSFDKAVADKATRYEWGKELVPGITAVDASGHTPGHTAFVVASGSARVFVQSDVTSIPHLFARNPHWQIGFDMDGSKAADTRRRIYDMLVAERMLVQGFHYPFPGIGYVEKDGNGYRVTPAPWNPTL